MSKVYIVSSVAGKAVIFEAPSTKAAKSAYQIIKKQAPGISVGVYGAKDLNTLRRSQRTLPPAKVTKSISDFVKNIGAPSYV